MALEIYMPLVNDGLEYANGLPVTRPRTPDVIGPNGGGSLCGTESVEVPWPARLKENYMLGLMSISFFARMNQATVDWGDIFWWTDSSEQSVRFERGKVAVSTNHDFFSNIGSPSPTNDANIINYDVGVVQGKWAHYTIVLNTKNVLIYINGVLKHTAGIRTGVLPEPTGNIKIFADPINNKTDLTDIRFYSHALSKAEINEIRKGKSFHINAQLPMALSKNLVDDPVAGSLISPDYPWDSTKHKGAITVSSWGPGYNGGVPSPEVGYHAHWVIENGIPTIIHNNLNQDGDGLTLGPRWLGISNTSSIGSLESLGIGVGDKVTIVADHWTSDEGGTGAHIGLYHKNPDDAYTFGPSIYTYRGLIPGVWQRRSHTFVIDSNWNTEHGYNCCYCYGHVAPVGVTVKVRNIKIYKGEGCDGHSRKNLSGDDLRFFDNACGISIKPEGDIAWGYDVDAKRHGIRIPKGSGLLRVFGKAMKSKGTLISWFKLKSHASDQSPLIEGRFYLNVRDNASVSAYWYGKTPAGYHQTPANLISLDTVHMAAVVWTDTHCKIYVDGVLKLTVATTGDDTLETPDTGFMIGNVSSTRSFDGWIYETMAYGTDLSDDEIMDEYECKARMSKGGALICNNIDESLDHPGQSFKLRIGGHAFGQTNMDRSGNYVNGTKINGGTRGVSVVVLEPSGKLWKRWRGDSHIGTSGSWDEYDYKTSSVSSGNFTSEYPVAARLIRFMKDIPSGHIVMFSIEDSCHLASDNKFMTYLERHFNLPRRWSLYRQSVCWAAKKDGDCFAYLDNGYNQAVCSTIKLRTNSSVDEAGVLQTHQFTQGICSAIKTLPPMSDGTRLLYDSGWVRVLNHNAGHFEEVELNDTLMFADKTEAANCNRGHPYSPLYSILDQISKFKIDGKFTFKLLIPEENLRNIWSQTSDPYVTTGLIEGYTAIDISHTINYWGGISKSSTSSCLIDGSPGNGTWHYAIGCINRWSDGFPGANESVRNLELWVWVGDLEPIVGISKECGITNTSVIEN